MPVMDTYSKIRPRRATAEEWQLINPVLMSGEWGVEFPNDGIGSGLCKFKFGDGEKAWNDLPYAFNAEAASAIYGGTVTVWHDIWLRTGTTEEWLAANPVLGYGEIVFDITKLDLKVGDGEHNFSAIPYIAARDEFDYDFGDISESI
jgi:hypothetical protein